MNALSNNLRNQPTALSTSVANAGPVALLPQVNLVEILHALRRRLWIVLLCALGAAAVTLAYLSTKPVLYSSHGSVYVKTHAPQVLDIKPLAQEESRELEQMRTVEQGLLSSTTLLALVEDHKLAEDPAFAPAGAGPQTLLEAMRDRVHVELRRGTRLIDITVEDTDPARAALLVRDLVTQFETLRDGGRNSLIAKASAGLEKEEARLRARMEESENAVRQFRIENPIPGLLAMGPELTVSEVDMLREALVEVRAERIRLQSEYEALRDLDPTDPEAMGGLRQGEHGPLVLEIEQQLQAKEVEFARVKERYLHKHPVYIETANEIERLKRSLTEVARNAGESLKTQYELAVDHESRLDQALNGASGEAVVEESVREAFSKLVRQAQVDRELHASVAKRLQETQIGSSWLASFLRWEDQPLVPERPSKPRKKLLTAASLFLGGMVGLMLAFLAELMDRRVREAGAVERTIGVPVLASLPHFTREALAELGSTGEDAPRRARPHHLAKFVFPHEQVVAGKATMLFTSAFKNDGKSVAALKCARTLARQGHRTLLIDADFREASLSEGYRKVRGDRRHGLAAYLYGDAKADEVFFETGFRGLWFVPAGLLDDDSSELLSRPGFRKLLEELGGSFDRIVIDSSAVVDDADVQSLVRHVDATCLVVRENVGRYRDIREAADVLRSAGGNLVGFVWNEVGSTEGNGATPRVQPPKENPDLEQDHPKLVVG